MEFNSHNPELSTKKIVLSDHTYQRVAERFGFKNKHEALGNVRKWLRQSKRIGKHTAEDGTECILYAYNGIAICLTLDLQKVITLFKCDQLTYKPIKEKVVELHEKEIRKLDRKENARIKRLKQIKLESRIEIANLEYRIYKTRSNAVKLSCQARINAIKDYLNELEEEINNIKSEKRRVAKSLVAII